jgi:DNA polymerase-4
LQVPQLFGYHTASGAEPQDRRDTGQTSTMNSVSRIILHVDMDAFFAAIEQLDHPELRGCPVIVGALPEERGVVATCSYEARRFGVRSAMPSAAAARLCPEGIFMPTRHERYSEVSDQIMAIFRELTPQVEPVSVDEAFLDISGVPGGLADPVAVARDLKHRIRERTGLTASVGVAPNKFLAKLASDMQKPDGLTLVPFGPEEIRAFLAPLPVGRIWGVGARTAEELGRHGLRHIGQIQQLAPETLARYCGPTFGPRLWQLARGIDDRPVEADPREEKSISNEETFATDIADPERLRAELIPLVEKVARRLRQVGRQARTIQIKLRFSDFRTITRQQSLPSPTDSDRVLLAAALALFARQSLPQPIRLIGFGVSGLLEQGMENTLRQPSLFREETENDPERDRALDQAVDELRALYGDRILRRGKC